MIRIKADFPDQAIRHAGCAPRVKTGIQAFWIPAFARGAQPE